MSPPTLNLIEPPWYGPVCPVVWEGWHREVSPYPDQFGFRRLDHIEIDSVQQKFPRDIHLHPMSPALALLSFRSNAG
jgi:hypothetical protein